MNTVAPGTGSFNGGVGAINGTMDISFFGPGNQSFNGIWSAFFNGSFSGMPENVSSWTASFTNGDVSAQLNGLQWNGTEWLANVSGSAGTTNFSGQAGGTYTQNQTDPSSGTFFGVGVGTSTAGIPSPPCQEGCS